MLAYVPLVFACSASFWVVESFANPQNLPGCRGVNQAWLDRHRALRMTIVSAKVCMLAHVTAQRLHRVLVLLFFPEPQNCPGCRRGVQTGLAEQAQGHHQRRSVHPDTTQGLSIRAMGGVLCLFGGLEPSWLQRRVSGLGLTTSSQCQCGGHVKLGPMTRCS